jgi:hypothetical protein
LARECHEFNESFVFFLAQIAVDSALGERQAAASFFLKAILRESNRFKEFIS